MVMGTDTSLDDARDVHAGGTKVVWYVALFVGTAGLAAALTVLFRSMRAVMEVGGACASGGAYEIATPCPDGVAVLINLAIWGGLLMLGLMIWATVRVHAPNIVWLAWPALFLSLGYNFLTFGLDPPGDAGVEWGWMMCAVVFALMGGVPLLLALPVLWRGQDAHRTFAGRTLAMSAQARNMTTPPNINVSPVFPGAAAHDLVSTLERLSVLHRNGSLTDAEYRAAKQDVLSRGGA